jgi:hypothetical protein
MESNWEIHITTRLVFQLTTLLAHYRKTELLLYEGTESAVRVFFFRIQGKKEGVDFDVQES